MLKVNPNMNEGIVFISMIKQLEGIIKDTQNSSSKNLVTIIPLIFISPFFLMKSANKIV